MEEKAKKIAVLLKLLANEQRLLILCALLHEPMTVSKLHSFTPNISQSALSQHLTQLRSVGILDSERQGMHVIYRIQDADIIDLMAFLKAHYCP